MCIFKIDCENNISWSCQLCLRATSVYSMPRRSVLKSHRRVSIPQCDRSIQTYLTSTLQISRTHTTSCYKYFKHNMETSSVVKLLSSTEQEEDNQDFSQNSQRIEISDCSSVSSEELLECTVVSRNPTDVEKETDLTQQGDRKEELKTSVKRKGLDQRGSALKKQKGNVVIMTMLTMLMAMSGIALEQYAKMYQKYKKSLALGKMDRTTQQMIFNILSVMGQLTKIYPGKTFLQKYLNQDIAKSLSTMSCNAVQKKKLICWLKEFTTPEEDTTYHQSTEMPASPLSASMLPSPVTRTSITCTSYTTADGRSSHVGVQPSAIYPDHHISEEGPTVSALYRPKTSTNFRSMSWMDQRYKYSVRSQGLEGDYVVKLEMYQWKKICGLSSQDWWKHSECRAFLPIPNKTRVMKAAIELQEAIREHLEAQPDAEGDYVQMK